MSRRIVRTVSEGRRRIMTAAAVLFALFVAAPHAAPADPFGTTPEAQAGRVQEGDEAPDFNLESLDGQTLRLSELRGEKNALIILFRGAW